MDRVSDLCDVATRTSEENHADTESDVFCQLPQLNNSFEDLEQQIKKKELLPHDVMGIENTWTEENAFVTPPSADYPIPLPPPSRFDDISCLDTDTNAVEPVSFPDPDLGTLFSSDTETQEDVRDSAACPGVCGLRNLGNTCFMASGLQCLAATPSLMQYFLTRQPMAEKNNLHSLTDQFASLLQKMWSGNYCVLRPVEFKQALGANYPQFKDFRQHDCQEFLALLLDNLHEQLNTASCKSILSDVSTAPPTPHSQCEMEKLVDVMDQESSAQTETLRCNQSSSSHSSESSGECRNLFRLRPIPEDVVPFKEVNVADVVPFKEVNMADVVHSKEVNMADVPFKEVNMADVVPFKEVNVASVSCCTQTLSQNGPEDVNFICNQTSSDSENSNHFTAQKFLKMNGISKNEVVLMEKNEVEMMEKNVVAHQLNNVSPCFRGLEDILKDAKTSNVNVLVTEQEANNEIRFDSEKFPKYENARRRDPLEMPNLTEYHNFDGKTVSVKRIKETNLLQEPLECSEVDLESSKCFNNIKRMKLEEQEKNFRMECERKLRILDPSSTGESSSTDEAGASSCHTHLNDEIEADKHWEKHLSSNQSVIVDTFQGQFKSTVVCSSCKHVSVTYEPFMYLSVPLPHAMERQICVTFVPTSSNEPIRYLVTLNKQDKVVKLKERLIKSIGQDAPKNLALAEVLDSHIARILDENSLLRYVNDTNRSIYAFELLPPPNPLKPEEQPQVGEPLNLASGLEGGDAMDIASVHDNGTDTIAERGDCGDVIGPMTESEYERLTSNSAVGPGEKGDGWRSCAICLEEMDTDLRRHASCSCILCEDCIGTSCRHYGGDKIECPVCGVKVKPETEFIPLDKLGDYKPTIRMLNVPIVFRLDSEGDGNNNKKVMKLFGHPNLVRLPNRIQGRDLYAAVDRIVPYSAVYSILLVDGQGYHCSRCMYTVHCRGCHIAPERDRELLLQTGDTLAVRFTEPVEHVDLAVEHPSMKMLRRQDPLSLYDCLQAFSESEQLDEHNPWYCPTCQKNQCATKTLSVWRYPDFLIVYLKRFIFHECVSVKLDNKVTFPLMGLCVSPPSLLQHGTQHPYNLYGCVCHYGGSAAGHYTSYAKNPRTSEWHYFNDDVVTKQKPQEEDYSNAYILFYQKQGVTFDLSVPKLLMGDGSPKPNIDQLILDLDSSVEQDEDMCHS